ncbi:MAG: 3-methyl-2-oxobutanoate hydroxymethyltransferase [Anaerolineae bacterium]|nr:3-methyl-2-oxobutanoate hydroxymethyltransferase [Anaerolineae bacterium]
MRTTILDIRKMKRNHQRIAMVTAYDAISARLVEQAGIPMILVGDSLGMVVQGNDTTVQVTLADMIYHTRLVMRGTQKALVVADLPFMTYKISPEQALTNAARLMQEGGDPGAVKMEGGAAIAPTVARVTAAGIPVMAHIGLTPQSVHQLGGWRAQGKDVDSAKTLLEDALALEQAGAFAIVLETIPQQVAKLISERLSIPTIGIGAGVDCDGQVQVLPDLLGLLDDIKPKHSKQYVNLADLIRGALSDYVREVEAGEFPTAAQSINADERMLAGLKKLAKGE